MDRLQTERLLHDRQALERATYFQRHLDQLRFDGESYRQHETWIAPAMGQLGDVRGRRLLDLGCGHGMAAVVLARRGAWVTAGDLSGGYLAEAAARAAANGVSLDLVQLDGHRLPFADGSFERIWGNAILHHLDVARAGRELHRVLAPGGIAVFCEPWGENPVLSAARRWFPYPGKQRTPDERPLRRRDVRVLEAIFPRVECRGYQLLSMLRRAVHRPGLISWLARCDSQLLAWCPALERFCRYVVLTLRRDR